MNRNGPQTLVLLNIEIEILTAIGQPYPLASCYAEPFTGIISLNHHPGSRWSVLSKPHLIREESKAQTGLRHPNPQGWRAADSALVSAPCKRS